MVDAYFHVKKSRVRNVKNLLVVCVGTAVQFSVFWSSVNLTSSVRIENGVGANTELILYACNVLGNATFATLCVKYLGTKNCVGYGIILYSLSMTGNFKPIFPVFAVTSVIVGFAATVYWTSVNCYIAELAKDYGSPGKRDSATFLFFGTFATFYQSSNIWGNVISYEELNVEEERFQNDTIDISEICGVNFCDSYVTGSRDILKMPSDERIKKVSAIYIACAIASGLFVLFFADPVKTPEKFGNAKVKDLLLSTVKCLKNPYHLLLAPIVFVSGLDVCFLMTDFTKAYISCTLGVSYIGYVLVTYGVTSTIFAIVLGYAERKVDRFIFVILGISILGGCVAALLLWTPSYNSKYFLFIIAGCWGFVDSIMQGQIKALYGVFFAGNNESAFACLSTFEGLGFLVGYSYDSQLCIKTKLIILAGVIGLSLICYIVAELLYRKKKTKGLNQSFNLSQIINSYNTYPNIDNGVRGSVQGEMVENINTIGVSNRGFEL